MLYILRLKSFSSQYRKAFKTSPETVYIFSINVLINELIPVTRYLVKEKFKSDKNRHKLSIENLWKLQAFRIARCLPSRKQTGASRKQIENQSTSQTIKGHSLLYMSELDSIVPRFSNYVTKCYKPSMEKLLSSGVSSDSLLL